MTDSSQDKPDAILYVPGIIQKPGDSVDNIALRIASALNITAHTAEAEFKIEACHEEEYDSLDNKSLKTRICSICRSEPGKEATNIADVYEFKYFDTLTKNYTKKNLFQKSLRLLIGLILTTPRLFYAFFGSGRKNKENIEKCQLIYAVYILSLLVIYLVTLGIAIFDTVKQIPQIQDTLQIQETIPSINMPEKTPAQLLEPSKSPQPPKLTFSQIIIIITAAIGVIYPNWQESITNAAVLYMSVIDYLGMGSRHKALGGQLLTLLDHIATKKYEHIHIVAYSFGSIIVLDNLFPLRQTPVERVHSIHTLATIGCPFDMIQVFWPDYFSQRNVISKVPKSWINLYSPIDVLSSNFRKDQKQDEPDVEYALQSVIDTEIKLIPQKNVVFAMGRPKDKLSFFEILVLVGLEAHTSYWESEYEAEKTVFLPIIEEIYKDNYPLT